MLIMVKLIEDKELNTLMSLIDASNKIVICAHVNPDGDAIGASLALMHFLSRCGKACNVVVPSQFPDFLRWMPGAQDIKVFARQEEEASSIVKAADLIFIVDLNDSRRLMGLETVVLESQASKIMIDHHMNPGDFCRFVISRPEMCSTGEVLCHLFWQMGEIHDLSIEESTCLYTAMMCDTGAFTYASGRPVIYECISYLLSGGIDKDRIYRNVYWTASPARLRLHGYMLYVKLKILNGLHASVMTLTNEERKLFSTKNGDTEGLVNMPLQIQGMRLSIFLTEDTEMPGVVKVSLRSVDDFPCNEMAMEFFNGGGHKNASGGRFQGSMEEALKRVDEAVHRYSSLLK